MNVRAESLWTGQTSVPPMLLREIAILQIIEIVKLELAAHDPCLAGVERDGRAGAPGADAAGEFMRRYS
jgi:hypothetical protein